MPFVDEATGSNREPAATHGRAGSPLLAGQSPTRAARPRFGVGGRFGTGFALFVARARARTRESRPGALDERARGRHAELWTLELALSLKLER